MGAGTRSHRLTRHLNDARRAAFPILPEDDAFADTMILSLT